MTNTERKQKTTVYVVDDKGFLSFYDSLQSPATEKVFMDEMRDRGKDSELIDTFKNAYTHHLCKFYFPMKKTDAIYSKLQYQYTLAGTGDARNDLFKTGPVKQEAKRMTRSNSGGPPPEFDRENIELLNPVLNPVAAREFYTWGSVYLKYVQNENVTLHQNPIVFVNYYQLSLLMSGCIFPKWRKMQSELTPQHILVVPTFHSNPEKSVKTIKIDEVSRAKIRQKYEGAVQNNPQEEAMAILGKLYYSVDGENWEYSSQPFLQLLPRALLVLMRPLCTEDAQPSTTSITDGTYYDDGSFYVEAFVVACIASTNENVSNAILNTHTLFENSFIVVDEAHNLTCEKSPPNMPIEALSTFYGAMGVEYVARDLIDICQIGIVAPCIEVEKWDRETFTGSTITQLDVNSTVFIALKKEEFQERLSTQIDEKISSNLIKYFNIYKKQRLFRVPGTDYPAENCYSIGEYWFVTLAKANMLNYKRKDVLPFLKRSVGNPFLERFLAEKPLSDLTTLTVLRRLSLFENADKISLFENVDVDKIIGQAVAYMRYQLCSTETQFFKICFDEKAMFKEMQKNFCKVNAHKMAMTATPFQGKSLNRFADLISMTGGKGAAVDLKNNNIPKNLRTKIVFDDNLMDFRYPCVHTFDFITNRCFHKIVPSTGEMFELEAILYRVEKTRYETECLDLESVYVQITQCTDSTSSTEEDYYFSHYMRCYCQEKAKKESSADFKDYKLYRYQFLRLESAVSLYGKLDSSSDEGEPDYGDMPVFQTTVKIKNIPPGSLVKPGNYKVQLASNIFKVFTVKYLSTKKKSGYLNGLGDRCDESLYLSLKATVLVTIDDKEQDVQSEAMRSFLGQRYDPSRNIHVIYCCDAWKRHIPIVESEHTTSTPPQPVLNKVPQPVLNKVNRLCEMLEEHVRSPRPAVAHGSMCLAGKILILAKPEHITFIRDRLNTLVGEWRQFNATTKRAIQGLSEDVPPNPIKPIKLYPEQNTVSVLSTERGAGVLSIDEYAALKATRVDESFLHIVVADIITFGESYNLGSTAALYLFDVPGSYSQYKQNIGRVMRGCANEKASRDTDHLVSLDHINICVLADLSEKASVESLCKDGKNFEKTLQSTCGSSIMREMSQVKTFDVTLGYKYAHWSTFAPERGPAAPMSSSFPNEGTSFKNFSEWTYVSVTPYLTKMLELDPKTKKLWVKGLQRSIDVLSTVSRIQKGTGGEFKRIFASEAFVDETSTKEYVYLPDQKTLKRYFWPDVSNDQKSNQIPSMINTFEENANRQSTWKDCKYHFQYPMSAVKINSKKKTTDECLNVKKNVITRTAKFYVVGEEEAITSIRFDASVIHPNWAHIGSEFKRLATEVKFADVERRDAVSFFMYTYFGMYVPLRDDRSMYSFENNVKHYSYIPLSALFQYTNHPVGKEFNDELWSANLGSCLKYLMTPPPADADELHFESKDIYGTCGFTYYTPGVER
jgi:hypothetical protein